MSYRRASRALGLVALLGQALAAHELPRPSGKYNVGATRHVIPFVNPNDPFWPANLETDYLATVYYPTLDPVPEPEKYLQPEMAAEMEKQWEFYPGSLAAIEARIAWNASYLDQVRGPTLFFGPGGGGPPTDAYTVLISELVSRGYVVAGLDHFYEQPFLRYPNGTGVPGLPLAHSFTQEELESLYDARLRDLVHFVDLWPLFVQDQQAPFNVSGPHGALGHSFGGSLSVSAAINASSVGAAINMDGTLWGNLVTNSSASDVKKPTLLFGQEGHTGETDPTFAWFTAQQTGWWRMINVKGATHLCFSDLAYWTTLGISDQTFGTVEGHRMMEITDTIVGAFFAEFLLGKPGDPILDEPQSDWPDIIIDDGSHL